MSQVGLSQQTELGDAWAEGVDAPGVGNAGRPADPGESVASGAHCPPPVNASGWQQMEQDTRMVSLG